MPKPHHNFRPQNAPRGSSQILVKESVEPHAAAGRRNSEASRKVAVRHNGVDYTVGQLLNDARRLAAVFPQEKSPVVTLLPRGYQLYVSQLAVLLQGGFFVPIDVRTPISRIDFLLKDSRTKIALTNAANATRLAELDNDVNVIDVKAILDIETDAESLVTSSDELNRIDLAGLIPHQDDDYIYMIYTSGSTGQPKGVPIHWRAMDNHYQWFIKEYNVTAEDRCMQISSPGFDISIEEIWGSLRIGATLHVVNDADYESAEYFWKWVQDNKITILDFPTALWQSLLRVLVDSSMPESVRLAIIGGEAVSPADVELWFSAVDPKKVRLSNCYGPTETTITSTHCDLMPEGTATIGKPIDNMQCVLVDQAGQKVLQRGEIGEIFISGDSVGQGYWHRPEQTAAAFYNFEACDGRWSYRTGDLVIRRSSGSIDFVGRIDDQLSIGGVRIDPSEVEAALNSIEGVKACLVARGGRGLSAFVEPVMTGRVPRVSSAEIARAARAVLPATHAPAVINLVETLPRNINGKLDRTALDSVTFLPEEPRTESAVPPAASDRGQTSEIADIFSRAFDGVAVGADSDFFDLGGDSLHAVAVVSMIENEIGQRVAIGELISSPTPALLAKSLRPNMLPTEVRSPSDRGDLVEWLRPTGARNPLVVLPPGGGNLLRYRPLVQALDEDIPVVGVRLPGADARSEIVETIEQQAEVMLEALDAAVVDGPYTLLGWSTGGLLAWEMARLLTARGDQVNGVVLVDTVMAGLRVDDAGAIKDKYQDLFKTEGLRAVVGEGAGRLNERASFALARRRYRAARDAGEAPTPLDAERQLGPVIRRAALDYSPVAQDVPVVYISASESENDVTLDPWAALQAGLPFEVVTVEGVHFLPEERCIVGSERAPDLVKALMAHLSIE